MQCCRLTMALLEFCVFVLSSSVVKTELSVVSFAEQFEYQTEKHDAWTKDGYQLGVYRILPRHSGPQRSPVLLMHGLFSSPMDYLVLGPGRALGFVLSAAGYDVWLGSVRGIPGSTGHVDTTITPASYWNFSLDEVAQYDVPAIVDLVLNKTGHKSLDYIGHSMGTTLLMMMLAELLEYRQKINIALLLSPIVFFVNPDPILSILPAVVPIVQKLLKYVRTYEFPPHYEEFWNIGARMMKTPRGLSFLKRAFNFVFGNDNHISETSAFGVHTTTESKLLSALAGDGGTAIHCQLTLVLQDLFSHEPTPTSTRLLTHYSQIIASGSFRKYNWGLFGNERQYGSASPPEYDLSRITTSVFLFVGNTDVFTSEEEIEKLGAVLPNSTTFCIQAKEFGHLSFIFSDLADELVNIPILHVLQHQSLPTELRHLCQIGSTSKLSDVWKLLETCSSESKPLVV